MFGPAYRLNRLMYIMQHTCQSLAAELDRLEAPVEMGQREIGSRRRTIDLGAGYLQYCGRL